MGRLLDLSEWDEGIYMICIEDDHNGICDDDEACEHMREIIAQGYSRVDIIALHDYVEENTEWLHE